MYIDYLEISDLRCFEAARASFQHPDRLGPDPPALKNVNLLLGNNGTGKTTVLRAVALAILSPVIQGSGYVPYAMIRRVGTQPAKKAKVQVEIVLHRQDVPEGPVPPTDRAETSIERRGTAEWIASPATLESWDAIYEEDSPAFLLVGYGASRRVESSTTFDSTARSKSRLRRYQRVAGLFEEHVTLTPLAAWLPALENSKPHRYSEVTGLINALLPNDTLFGGEMDDGEYLFRRYNSLVPFGALSDGYRAYIGWVADLLYHIHIGCPDNTKLASNRGVVLVDEIDLHLHPEWQRTVVRTLAEVFPRLQFILTSHSPIVTGTLEAKNIHVMETEPSGVSSIGQLSEEVHGLNADQVLLSSYFDLPSTRDPAVVDELRVLAQKARDGDADAAVEYLRALSPGSPSRSKHRAGPSPSARQSGDHE